MSDMRVSFIHYFRSLYTARPGGCAEAMIAQCIKKRYCISSSKCSRLSLLWLLSVPLCAPESVLCRGGGLFESVLARGLMLPMPSLPMPATRPCLKSCPSAAAASKGVGKVVSVRSPIACVGGRSAVVPAPVASSAVSVPVTIGSFLSGVFAPLLLFDTLLVCGVREGGS